MSFWGHFGGFCAFVELIFQCSGCILSWFCWRFWGCLISCFLAKGFRVYNRYIRRKISPKKVRLKCENGLTFETFFVSGAGRRTSSPASRGAARGVTVFRAWHNRIFCPVEPCSVASLVSFGVPRPSFLRNALFASPLCVTVIPVRLYDAFFCPLSSNGGGVVSSTRKTAFVPYRALK